MNMTSKLKAASYSSDRGEMKTLSDEHLLFMSVTGNIGAFDIISARYKNYLMNYIFNSIFDFEKSLKIVRETFIRILREKNTLSSGDLVSIRLFSTADSLIKKNLRHKKWRSFFSDSHAFYRARNVSDLIVHEALGSLDNQSRNAIILRDITGKSYDEISRITRMPVSHARACVAEARRKLKNHMKAGVILPLNNMQIAFQPSKQ
jgi:RNA polymerase sigma-70 factor, ECF subfamily